MHPPPSPALISGFNWWLSCRRILHTQKMPTACLHSVFRSSRYVPLVLFFYIPISVPGLCSRYAGVILPLPPLRYFPSIAYCVPRHEKVELVVSSPTFLEFDSWWYWWLVLSFFFFLLGGRTAWSSSVIVQGKTFAARYWYDGPFVNNALEDAAEVALIILDPDNHQALATTNYSGQLYPQ